MPIVPKALEYFSPETLLAWADKLTVSKDGSHLILDQISINVIQGLENPKHRTLVFSVKFPRVGETKIQVVNLRERRARLAISYFPFFKAEGWKKYFVHFAQFSNLKEVSVISHFKSSDPITILASGDSDSNPVLRSTEGRPDALELIDLNSNTSWGMFLLTYQDKRVLNQDSQVRLAIDLGSANTTIALEMG